MIRGIHGLLFSSRPKATRAFLKDKLRLPSTDIGDGWLIFDLPAGDLGVHPVGEEIEHAAGTHTLSFWCDDIRATVADLRQRGVKVTRDIGEQSWGFYTYFTMPGGLEVELYEPKYEKRAARTRRRAAKRSPRKG